MVARYKDTYIDSMRERRIGKNLAIAEKQVMVTDAEAELIVRERRHALYEKWFTRAYYFNMFVAAVCIIPGMWVWVPLVNLVLLLIGVQVYTMYMSTYGWSVYDLTREIAKMKDNITMCESFKDRSAHNQETIESVASSAEPQTANTSLQSN